MGEDFNPHEFDGSDVHFSSQNHGCLHFVIPDLGNEDQEVAGSASGSELTSVGPEDIKI